MQVVASLSGVAKYCVDPNALELGHRLFLAVWERGYAEACIRTSENCPSTHSGESAIPMVQPEGWYEQLTC